jgi:hypothetical protein
MGGVADGPRPSRFLVEVTRGLGETEDIGDLAARSRAVCRELSIEGDPIRLLRSVFVPEDGSSLLVFEAETEGRVREACERSAIRVVEVAEALGATVDPVAGG